MVGHSMDSSTREQAEAGASSRPKDDLLAKGFRSVDGGDVDAIARCQHCLEFISQCAEFKRVRSVAFDALQIDSSDLIGVDVGCGPGLYTVQIAQRLQAAPGASIGKIIGLDLSSEFISTARAKQAESTTQLPLTFEVGDARSLATHSALGPDYVDRIYIERTLQHIPRADFSTTIGQFFQTLRAGGVAVAVEPNWELFTVRSEQLETTRKILRHWVDNFNHAQVGMNLVAAFRRAGFTEVCMQQVPVEYRSFEQADLVYDLTRSAQATADSGAIAHEHAAEWVQGLAGLGDDFYCSLAMCVVSGYKPS